MTRNILLTSLDALGSDRDLRYYSVRNEFGCDYCEAVQSTEASTRYILARFPIEEILVLGVEASSDGGVDGRPLRLKDARALYSEDTASLSAFNLYLSRLAQYIDETSLEQQAYDALLPEEKRLRLIDFIRDFQEQYSERETKRLNRFLTSWHAAGRFMSVSGTRFSLPSRRTEKIRGLR